jgi:AraC-like DNA-binding protein
VAKPLSLIRAGNLAGYIELARSCQLDAIGLLRSVGLHPRDLTDVDASIPATAAMDLLERSAELAGLEDFGLRLAASRSLADIGPVGLLVREEPTVGHAIRAAERYLRRYSNAMEFRMEEQQSMATLRAQYIAASRGHTRQATELLVGTVHRVINALAGATWTAESVSFAHPAPTRRTIHNSFFKTQIHFDNPFNGFVMRTDDLGARIRMAEIAMPRYMKQFVEEIAVAQPEISINDAVRQLVFVLLPTGRCSSTAVASHLGVDRKTVNRRLSAHGASYSEILNEVRIELVRRHIRTGQRSLTQTAQLLGFSSLATFSRWFRTEFGMSATSWRTTDRQEDATKPAKAKPRPLHATRALPRRPAANRRRPAAAR